MHIAHSDTETRAIVLAGDSIQAHDAPALSLDNPEDCILLNMQGIDFSGKMRLFQLLVSKRVVQQLAEVLTGEAGAQTRIENPPK